MLVGRVQERGQVTVPRKIREACGIESGTELVFVQTGQDRFECQVLPQESITDLLEQFAMPGTAPDLDVVREEIGDDLVESYGGPVSPS